MAVRRRAVVRSDDFAEQTGDPRPTTAPTAAVAVGFADESATSESGRY